MRLAAISSSLYRFLCLTVCVGLIAHPSQAASVDRNTPQTDNASDVVLEAEVDGVTSVSAGYFHTCGVKPDNSVVCWGSNDDNNQATPPNETFTQISAGALHNCGIKLDNKVACWGFNEDGRATPLGSDFSQISAGGTHTCGVKSNNTAACWGDDFYGQSTPPASESFNQVSAGFEHTCGIKLDHTVACWGDLTLPEVNNPPDGTFTQVSAGDYHNCAINMLDNTLACWGAGTENSGIYPDYGQAAPPGGAFAQVSAGGYHTCGVRPEGTVACWGNNLNGQATPPTGVFTQVSAGLFHTCGVRLDGTVTCWGDNDFGKAPAVSLSPPSLEAGMLGHVYNQSISASGATSPYQFSAEGELPPGLSLAPEGIISGTPTSLGVYTFTVQARDSSSPQFSGQKEYSLHIKEVSQVFLPLVKR